MKSIKFCLFLFILTLSFSAHSQTLTTFKGKVVGILDGKTLLVNTSINNQVTIQLQFIDVPETGRPLSDIVKGHLQQLAYDKTIEYYVTSLSKTTIVLGKVSVNGTDLSQQMIRDGAAWYNLPDERLYSPADRDLYKNTETAARNEKRGVWSVDGLKPTWEYKADIEAKRLAEEKAAEAARLAAETKRREEAESRRSLRQSDEDRLRANDGVRMWADPKGAVNFTGYTGGYDAGKNSTSFSTLPIALQSMLLKPGDSLSLKVNHSFPGKDLAKATGDFYFFEVNLKSPELDFSKLKGQKLNFIVGRDKYSLDFLNFKSTELSDPSDATGKTKYKLQTLGFKMAKADFQKLILAPEVEYDLEILKGTIGGVDFDVIKKLP